MKVTQALFNHHTLAVRPPMSAEQVLRILDTSLRYDDGILSATYADWTRLVIRLLTEPNDLVTIAFADYIYREVSIPFPKAFRDYSKQYGPQGTFTLQ